MSRDKIGPHEQRLRELREERIRRAKAPRPIPYAGKEFGERSHLYLNKRGSKTGKKTK